MPTDNDWQSLALEGDVTYADGAVLGNNGTHRSSEPSVISISKGQTANISSPGTINVIVRPKPGLTSINWLYGFFIYSSTGGVTQQQTSELNVDAKLNFDFETAASQYTGGEPLGQSIRVTAHNEASPEYPVGGALTKANFLQDVTSKFVNKTIGATDQVQGIMIIAHNGGRNEVNFKGKLDSYIESNNVNSPAYALNIQDYGRNDGGNGAGSFVNFDKAVNLQVKALNGTTIYGGMYIRALSAKNAIVAGENAPVTIDVEQSGATNRSARALSITSSNYPGVARPGDQMTALNGGLNVTSKAAGSSYGLYIYSNAGSNLDFSVAKDTVLKSTSENSAVGAQIFAYNGGKADISLNNLQTETDGATGAEAVNIINNGAGSKSVLKITGTSDIKANSAAGEATGIYEYLTSAASDIIIEGQTSVTANSKGNATGIYKYGTGAGSLSNLSAAAPLTIKATSTDGGTWGVFQKAITQAVALSEFKDKVTIAAKGKTKSIAVTSEATAGSSSTVNLLGGVDITTEAADAEALSAALLSSAKDAAPAVINVAKDVKIDAKSPAAALAYAALSTGEGAVIKVNEDGEGLVDVKGRIWADTKGAVSWNMTKAGSKALSDIITKGEGSADFKMAGAGTVLTGFARNFDEGSYGTLKMAVKDDSLWNMTESSSVNELEATNAAVVDMTYDNALTTVLTVGRMSGSAAMFKMNTDFASQTDGDKIHITESDGGNHYISVTDASFNVGVPTQTGELLLVTDASGKSSFSGYEIYKGGLWTYVPDLISKTAADDAAITGKNWYLKAIISATTNDTKDFLNTGGALYSAWINSNDTLRKRFGELRDHSTEQGFWIRAYAGKLSGDHFKTNYTTYQAGYDHVLSGNEDTDANHQWIGGAAFEYSRGNVDYDVSDGSNNMVSGMLYAIRKGIYGDNLDIVLKHGRINGDISTHGLNHDMGDYSTTGTSLSVEYNKRYDSENGFFFEPQAQFVWGRIASDSYNTKNGTKVEMESVTSAIGRLGILLGMQKETYNYYFKASLLHEFSGDVNMRMTAQNGEKASLFRSFSDTWFELGLGANVRFDDNKHFYFDVERGFGSDIAQKQWQINLGLRMEL